MLRLAEQSRREYERLWYVFSPVLMSACVRAYADPSAKSGLARWRVPGLSRAGVHEFGAQDIGEALGRRQLDLIDCEAGGSRMTAAAERSR